MKTFTQIKNLGGSASNNTSATNLAFIGQLANDTHRYLLQKYFDNEKTVTITTIGAQSLTLTGALAIGATTGTLTAAWTLPTCSQYVNFSSGEQRMTLFTTGSASISWANGLNNTTTTAIATVGVQDYSIPANVSKIKDDTVNVGQLKYHPKFIQTIQEWNNVNFLPYTSDNPSYAFVYNGKFSLFPIPATTGNIITFSYKSKVIDMTYEDYTTGTLATSGMTVGSTAVTCVSSSWSTTFPLNTDISYQNLYFRANVATGGDGVWYPILKFTSDTTLVLSLPVINTPNITTSTTYTIGQMPLLQEDFQDMLVYGPMRTYFSTVVPDPGRFKQHDDLFKEKLVMLKEYAGTKVVSLDLEGEPQAVNPNLFIYNN